MQKKKLARKVVINKKVTLFFFYACFSCMLHATEMDSNDPETIDTVKTVGNWINDFKENCTKGVDYLTLTCKENIYKDSKGNDELSAVKIFGTWLESCKSTTIGKGNDKNFHECLEIKALLH